IQLGKNSGCIVLASVFTQRCSSFYYVFVEDVVSFTGDIQISQWLVYSSIALVFHQYIAPANSPVAAVIHNQQFCSYFLASIQTLEWNRLSPSSTQQGKFISITRLSMQIVENGLKIPWIQGVTMIISSTAILSNSLGQCKNPCFYHFLSAVQIIFPQPYDLIEEIFFYFSLIQESRDIIDIYGIVIEVSILTSSSSSGSSSWNPQVIQDIDPAIISSFVIGIGTDHSTYVDAVKPVRTTSQHQLNRTVIPASFVKSLGM